MFRTYALAALSVLTAGMVVAACSGAGVTGSSGFGSGGASGGTEGTQTNSGPSGSEAIGSGFATSSGTQSGPGSGGGCAGTATMAKEIPLDIFIMLDQSGSMDDPIDSNNPGSPAKWPTVTSAIDQFVQQPTAAGIGIGLQFFGVPTGGNQCLVQFGCTVDADCGAAACGPCLGGICFGALNVGADSCNPADYTSAAVPIALLPGNAAAIMNVFAKRTPTGTPTAPALWGAIDFAKQWKQKNPTHTVVNVLATDGMPEECTPTAIGTANDPPAASFAAAQSIASIAAYGVAGNPKILTFVIGVGDQVPNLDTIAAAGGTMKSFIVNDPMMGGQQFLMALNAIRGTALQCTYEIPDPGNGMNPDYSSVNVEYKPGDGSPTQTIPKVADKNACMGGDGWYYDSDANPTQIIMCDATCNKLSMDAKGEVDIVLGCKTVVK